MIHPPPSTRPPVLLTCFRPGDGTETLTELRWNSEGQPYVGLVLWPPGPIWTHHNVVMRGGFQCAIDELERHLGVQEVFGQSLQDLLITTAPRPADLENPQSVFCIARKLLAVNSTGMQRFLGGFPPRWVGLRDADRELAAMSLGRNTPEEWQAQKDHRAQLMAQHPEWQQPYRPAPADA